MHAAKSCPGRPRRIDKAVGAFAPTSLGLLDFVARRKTHFAPKAAPFLALVAGTPTRLLAAGGTRRGRFLWRLRCSAWGRARLRAS